MAISLGDSNKSKNGGVSGLAELLRSASGEEEATEASFERKGSLGFIGGMGILAAFLAPKAPQLSFKAFVLGTVRHEDAEDRIV